ncbi:hypothetical protein KAW50_03490 [candidate division WOR-3 bacterium]|nr:hypothetical protein [candidate division WOR-3 bacterium]
MNDNHLRYALLYFRERLQDTALSQRHKNPAKTLLKIGAVMAALEEELNKRELLEEMLMKQYD